MSKEFSLQQLELIRQIENLNYNFRNSVVSFDIDQVEVDSASTAIQEINRRLGTEYSVADLTAYWGLVEILKRDHKEIAEPTNFAIGIWNDPEVIGKALPVSGSIILSRYLFDEGISAYRITSRPASLRDTTLIWYKKSMPWVSSDSIHIQPDGSEIKPDFKVAEIGKLEVDFHFEDSWEHAEEIVAKTNAIVILIPQPWNRSYVPEVRSKIITIPDSKYQTLPKLIRAYIHLSDLFKNS